MNRSFQSVLLRIVLLSLFAAILCVPGWPCYAADHKTEHERLDDMVACVVGDVRDWLNQQSVREITVGGVKSPANCSSGGVLQSLIDEFKLQQVTYKRSARYQLWGEFVSQAGTKADCTKAAKFEFSIRDQDKNSETVKKLDEHKVVGCAEVEKLLPPPVSASASSQSTATISSSIGTEPASSPFKIEGTRVLNANKEQYGLEVLLKVAKDEYKALTPSIEDGVAFVSIPTDGVYAVRIINRSDNDMAVDLSIDGISMFQFCKDRKTNGKPAYTHYIISAKSEPRVKGWYRDGTSANEFLVSNSDVLPKEMQGLTDKEKTGVVTAQFCVATSGTKSSAKEQDGIKRTILGNQTEQKSELEVYTWDSNKPVATVAIRYDKK